MLGQVPFIRAPRGAAAEQIARKLDSKIRDHLAPGGANANLRLSVPTYAPAGGLFTEGTGVVALERPGEQRLPCEDFSSYRRSPRFSSTRDTR